MSIGDKAVLMICACGIYAGIAVQVLHALTRNYRYRKANSGKEKSGGIEPGLALRPFQCLLLGILHGIAGILLIGVLTVICRG